MKLNHLTGFHLDGHGPVKLSTKHHLATGGEASVYRLDTLAIKLYTDTGRLSQPGMIGRIQSLTELRHPGVTAPRGLVTTTTGRPVGYWMDFVDQAEALPSVCTNDFRRRTSFDDNQASKLVGAMFGVMSYAHGAGAIMVDPNELNWAITSQNRSYRPRALDVDAWVLGNYTPSSVAVMPSIRDWHSAGIGQAADRFGLAVVTFQVFTGIHPYKGTLDGYRRGDLVRRMQDNASVFTPGVRLNQAVRDPGRIPRRLLDWYKGVFDHGDRSDPPSKWTASAVPSQNIVTKRIAATAGGKLTYTRVYESIGDPVVQVYGCGVVKLASGKLVDLATERVLYTTTAARVQVTTVESGWLIAELEPEPQFNFVSKVPQPVQPLSLGIDISELVSYQNRQFVVTPQGLTELLVKHFARPVLTTGRIWQATSTATRWYDGVGILDAMGATFVIAPFGEGSCAIIRVPELDGQRVIAAISGPRCVVLSAMQTNGSYHHVELVFDRSYTSYQINQTEVDTPQLNRAILPKGVMVAIIEDGEIVITVPTTGDRRLVHDSQALTSLALASWGNRAVAIRDGALWQLQLA